MNIRVSVVMANLNGAAHIAAAVRSVLRQTERALELIISDDGSTDDSLARAREAAAGDERLVIVRSDAARTGPAAARNRALAVARGIWIAVVDNDDFIAPERIERLINAAEAEGADIAADDLLTFYEDGSRAPHAHLRGALAQEPRWIDAAAYERGNALMAGGPTLGYLKPVFRRVRRDGAAVRYDESLRIAEDADLILRMLADGARFRVYPELGYFYRKHAGSISHRLDAVSIAAMDKAAARIDASDNPDLRSALRAGQAARADVLAFTKMVDALKARDIGGALGAAMRRPGALWLMRYPIAARFSPRAKARTANARPRVTLLSRQRIVGATNGSSAYVLALAGALKQAGYAVDYIGASPKIFGRWAALKLRPELGAFERYAMHGGVRVGSLVFSRDPGVWVSSALAVAERLLQRVGVKVALSEPADFAQNAEATRADQLFIARHASPNATAVLCDYAFLAPLAPYAMAPGAPSFTIMHDLISGRVSNSATEKNVITVGAAEEFRLLGMTDGVIAIQAEEAAKVRAQLPSSRVIVAQHAATIAVAAQPGVDDTLLFVGSSAPANVAALERFLRESWPAIRTARPKALLKVAGSVGRAVAVAPEGVAMLGVVGDLTPLYAEAGVVISPLYTGSGLKIKLIEALAAGKAVVGTGVTAQGVEDVVRRAMVIADDPAVFARDCIALLSDRGKRVALAEKALVCARDHFSADACFRDFVGAIKGGAHTAPREAAVTPALD